MSSVVEVAAGPAGDVPAIAGIPPFAAAQGASFIKPGVLRLPALIRSDVQASFWGALCFCETPLVVCVFPKSAKSGRVRGVELLTSKNMLPASSTIMHMATSMGEES